MIKKTSKLAIILLILAISSVVFAQDQHSAKNDYHSQAKKIAHSFVYPARQPIVKTPGDYGLTYKDVSIETDDGITLAGWLMKGTGDAVVIIGHVGTFSKYGWSLEAAGDHHLGYTRDVEFIPTAKHLVNAGYSVLMYDQRHHGESGVTPGGAPLNPVDAHLDSKAVVEFVENHSDLAGKNIGLLSYCQNSMITMVAMTKLPEILKKAGVKAFVAVQPISPQVLFKNLGFTAPLTKELEIVFAEYGLPLEDLEPLKHAPNIFVPILFVQGIMDPLSSIDSSRDIYNAIPTEKEALWLPGNIHRFDAYNWFNDHPEKLLEFFDKQL